MKKGKLSDYFLEKTLTIEFKENLLALIETLKDKKVLVYGAGAGFEYLYKKFPLKTLNIVAIADRKFKKETVFYNHKAINPKNIKKENFDKILISNEASDSIFDYLTMNLNIEASKIDIIFKEEIDYERSLEIFLKKYKPEEQIKELKESLKGKTVVIYGAGNFFEAVKKHYDLSGLNIIGISDSDIKRHKKDAKLFDYPVFTPKEIAELNPDYVLVAKNYYVGEIYYLYKKYLKKTKIKIRPLIKKPLWDLIKEV